MKRIRDTLIPRIAAELSARGSTETENDVWDHAAVESASMSSIFVPGCSLPRLLPLRDRARSRNRRFASLLATGSPTKRLSVRDVLFSPAERLPMAPIRSLVKEIATRVNYGLARTDAATALTKGKKVHIAPGLQLWFWEVNGEDEWPAEFAAELEERKKERDQVSDLRFVFLCFRSPPSLSLYHTVCLKCSSRQFEH